MLAMKSRVFVVRRELTPPGEEASFDPVIKDDIHKSPGRIVDTGGRGNVIGSHENERPVDESQPIPLSTCLCGPVFPQSKGYQWA